MVVQWLLLSLLYVTAQIGKSWDACTPLKKHKVGDLELKKNSLSIFLHSCKNGLLKVLLKCTNLFIGQNCYFGIAS